MAQYNGSDEVEKNLKKSNVSLEITASILPKAKITRYEGKYELHSHL